MSKNVSPSPNGQRACPHCGQAFTCGLSSRLERCWCFDYPHVISMADASREGCVCPACLTKMIDRLTNQQNEANV